MALYVLLSYQNPTHPYEQIGYGEGGFPYEKLWLSTSMVIFLMTKHRVV